MSFHGSRFQWQPPHSALISLVWLWVMLLWRLFHLENKNVTVKCFLNFHSKAEVWHVYWLQIHISVKPWHTHIRTQTHTFKHHDNDLIFKIWTRLAVAGECDVKSHRLSHPALFKHFIFVGTFVLTAGTCTISCVFIPAVFMKMLGKQYQLLCPLSLHGSAIQQKTLLDWTDREIWRGKGSDVKFSLNVEQFPL